MVARILRAREQRPIISTYFSSGARIQPTGAQGCPPLVTPLTFESIRHRGRSKENFSRIRGPRKTFSGFGVGFGGENYDPTGL